MAWALVSLRRLRDERAAAVGFLCLVLVTAFVAAIAPRAVETVADRSLRTELAAATPLERDLELNKVVRLSQAGRPSPDEPASLAAVDAVGVQLRSTFPAAVQHVAGAGSSIVETPSWHVTTGTTLDSTFTLRIQPGIEQRIRVTAGRLPNGRIHGSPAPGGAPGDLPLVTLEVAMSGSAAQKMGGVVVGATLPLGPDPLDPLSSGHRISAAVQIVGIYDPIDPADQRWTLDPTLVGWRIRPVSSNVEFVDAKVLLSPDVFPSLLNVMKDGALPLIEHFRYPVDEALVTSAGADDLVAALRRLESLYPATSGVTPTQTAGLRSNLLRLMEAHQAEWRSASAVLAVLATGFATVAAATLGLVTLLLSDRRRRILALCRARGASSRQVVGSILLEGLLLTLPAAGIALLAAIALLPTGGSVPSGVGVAAVAAFGTFLLVLVLLPIAFSEPRRSAPEREGEPASLTRIGPRRLVAEGLVVLLALVGASLLRERGLLAASSATQLPAADPLIAAVPALAGIAAGLVALRLYPFPTRLFAAAAALRRDLVPVLAIRRATRAKGAGQILLILLATAAIGTFAATILVSLDRSADAVAWHDVGAPWRLSAGSAGLPKAFDPAGLPGVEGAASASQGTVTLGSAQPSVLLAIDMQPYAGVVAGTPAVPALPPELLGAGGDPLPAIVSSGLRAVPGATGAAALPIAVGQTFRATIGRDQLNLVAVAVWDAFPTIQVGRPFVVVAREQLRRLHPADVPPLAAAFLRAPENAAQGLRSALALQAPGVILQSQTEAAEAIRSAPVVVAVRVGVEAVVLGAVAYAALAVAAALALAGSARRIEGAHLRALGLSDRQGLGLVLLEHGPVVLVAFGLGVALGVALFTFLRPGLGLAAVVGSAVSVPISIEPGYLLLLLVAVVGILAVGLILAGGLARRADPAGAIRRGIE